MDMQIDSALRKALLGRNRDRPRPVRQGAPASTAAAQERPAEKGTVLGLVMIIGKQCQNYCISHGGITKPVAPEFIWPATTEEA
eukprot:2508013-Pyramimonas_sp.AAC.1